LALALEFVALTPSLTLIAVCHKANVG